MNKLMANKDKTGGEFSFKLDLRKEKLNNSFFIPNLNWREVEREKRKKIYDQLLLLMLMM